MAYQRPNIVSGVTKATKAFFENIFDGLDEAAERDEAFSEGLNGKLSKADADANYAPLPAGAGTAGQVLTKTADGTAWTTVSGGSGTAVSYTDNGDGTGTLTIG